MHLSFSSKLFHVDDNQTPNPFDDVANANDAVPTWDVADQDWKLSCSLGTDCDQTVTTVGGNLIFSYVLVNPTDQLTFQETTGGSQVATDLFMAPVEAVITFQCTYADTLSIDSTVFNVKGSTAIGTAVSTGSLIDGFSVKLYKSDWTTEIDPQKVFIGYPMYAEVKWTVSSAQSAVNFYVKTCNLKSTIAGTERSVGLIVDTCYAENLGAEQKQADKIVGDKSRFEYTSFVLGGYSTNMDATLACEIKLCLTASQDCNTAITGFETTCAGMDATFGYAANTYT